MAESFSFAQSAKRLTPWKAGVHQEEVAHLRRRLILPPVVPENPTLALDLRWQASVSFVGLYPDVAAMIHFSSVKRERERLKKKDRMREGKACGTGSLHGKT